jgi:pantoate--beta-alanine ligase
MQRLDSIPALRQWRENVRQQGLTVAFVPTMGALHEGHLSLVRQAKKTCDKVIASVFVNPLQFGPSEDFRRYPRDLEADSTLLEDAGAAAVFTTTPNEMYPRGFATYVTQEGLPGRLEGAARPGHFRGVLTVVLKLINLVAPHKAFFGHKDFQQTVVLRRMAEDLNLNADIVVGATVRDPDGLALSSRNRNLSPEQRREALGLSRALEAAKGAFATGERCADALELRMREVLGNYPELRIDYAIAVCPETLQARSPLPETAVALIAVEISGTRLIDNTPLRPRADVTG